MNLVSSNFDELLSNDVIDIQISSLFETFFCSH